MRLEDLVVGETEAHLRRENQRLRRQQAALREQVEHLAYVRDKLLDRAEPEPVVCLAISPSEHRQGDPWMCRHRICRVEHGRRRIARGQEAEGE